MLCNKQEYRHTAVMTKEFEITIQLGNYNYNSVYPQTDKLTLNCA